MPFESHLIFGSIFFFFFHYSAFKHTEIVPINKQQKKIKIVAKHYFSRRFQPKIQRYKEICAPTIKHNLIIYRHKSEKKKNKNKETTVQTHNYSTSTDRVEKKKLNHTV